jgi:hypothetical protein
MAHVSTEYPAARKNLKDLVRRRGQRAREVAATILNSSAGRKITGAEEVALAIGPILNSSRDLDFAQPNRNVRALCFSGGDPPLFPDVQSQFLSL